MARFDGFLLKLSPQVLIFWIIVFAFLVRLPGAFSLPLFIDEPLYLVQIATADHSLWKLYEQTMLNKPIMAAAYYGLAGSFPQPYLALWVLTHLSVTGTAVLLFRVARLLGCSASAGLVGACNYLVLVSFTPNGVASSQLEHPANFCVVFCVYLSLKAVLETTRSYRYWSYIVAAGAWVLAATLMKQYFLLLAVVPAVGLGSLALLLGIGTAVFAALALHVQLFPGSAYNLFQFSGLYYKPSPVNAFLAIGRYWLLTGMSIVAMMVPPLLAGGPRYMKTKARNWGRRFASLRPSFPVAGLLRSASVRVIAGWVFVALCTTLFTQGWKQHMLVFAPLAGTLAAVVYARLEMEELSMHRSFVLVMAMLSLAGGYCAIKMARYDNHRAWTYTLVDPSDYAFAVASASSSGARSAFVFPAPLPEFYFEAKLRPAGFNAENDHRKAIGASDDLQARFVHGMHDNPPDLCIHIVPRPDKLEYVVPAYYRFVLNEVAGRHPLLVRRGRVSIYNCAQPK